MHTTQLVSLQHQLSSFYLTLAPCLLRLQVVNVLGFKLPFYKSATLLLSLGLSIRVLYYLFRQRPHVIHVSTPGIMCFAAGEQTSHGAASGIQAV